MGSQSSAQQAQFDDTVQAYGTVTAPGANTDIVTLALPAGHWELSVHAHLGTGGVPAAADSDNIRLRDNTAAANIVTLPLAAVQNGEPFPVKIRKKFLVPTTVAVRSVGAGTAAVVYSCLLVATKISDL